MSATIYSFPTKNGKSSVQALSLSLHGEIEIDVAVTCINLFGNYSNKITIHDVQTLDPVSVIQCLEISKDCWFFSSDFKTVVNNILNNVTLL